MAYFARLENDFVVEVRVVDHAYMKANPQRYSGTWVETFLDGDDPKLMASPGYTYDEDRDAFIPPKPFESWVLNEATCLWEAPLPYPEDEGSYTWNEELFAWELVEVE
jgi:hypothetical protein